MQKDRSSHAERPQDNGWSFQLLVAAAPQVPLRNKYLNEAVESSQARGPNLHVEKTYLKIAEKKKQTVFEAKLAEDGLTLPTYVNTCI